MGLERGRAMIDRVLDLLKYQWLIELKDRVKASHVWQYSTFITYYILFTLFPLIVGVMNAVKFHQLNLDRFFELSRLVLPEQIAERLVVDFQVIYDNSTFGIYLIAFISSVWTISMMMNSLIMGLNDAYGVPSRRHIIVTRLYAFVFLLVLLGWFGAVGMVIYVCQLTGILRGIILLLATFFTWCFLYRFGPNAHQSWRQVIPGALLATGSIFIASIIYLLVLAYIPPGSILVTLLGGFLIILSVLQKVNMMVLVGGMLNAYLIEQQGEIEVKGDNSRFIKLLQTLSIIDW